MTAASPEHVSLDLLAHLATRLEAVALHVGVLGSSISEAVDPPQPKNAYRRVQEIQHSLKSLCASDSAAGNLLDLGKCCFDISLLVSLSVPVARFPEPVPSQTPTFSSTSEQLVALKAYTKSIPAFVSQLNLAQDLHVPSLESFAGLASCSPRVRELETDLAAISEETKELRLRSAALLQRWYVATVLSEGDLWLAWEERLEMIEKVVRMQEALLQDKFKT